MVDNLGHHYHAQLHHKARIQYERHCRTRPKLYMLSAYQIVRSLSNHSLQQPPGLSE
ncbi:unnamed protein product [Periconia digitata]|uniref:Uncharacterized protein n=1 Tax=Periconia digitata TaxID=1303443 RepID=A0A9W4UL67_9PLEO|nr:unnamed protein product [Periconia digitata]